MRNVKQKQNNVINGLFIKKGTRKCKEKFGGDLYLSVDRKLLTRMMDDDGDNDDYIFNTRVFKNF